MQATPDPATPRLRFHRHTISDYADIAAQWGDPRTTRYIGGTPFTAEDSWSLLLRNAGHWALAGFGFWVIRNPADGTFLGEVGFKQFRRGLWPEFQEMPEMGWVLAPSAAGSGLATEAAQAALAWSDLYFEWPETICIIDPENAASRAVATKCGFVEFARTEYRGKLVIGLRRPRGG
jgi:RimJ/RimL family protein N-acetyltransferase